MTRRGIPLVAKRAKIHHMPRRELNIRLICIYLTPSLAQFLGLNLVLKYTRAENSFKTAYLR